MIVDGPGYEKFRAEYEARLRAEGRAEERAAVVAWLRMVSPSFGEATGDAVRDLLDDLDVRMAERDALAARVERLREALDIIATCPPAAVHLMPLAAQAAIAADKETP